MNPAVAIESPDVDWLAEARRVGHYLQGCARRSRDGTVVWLKPLRPDRGEIAPRSLGPYLYAGCAGVALFLAALGHVLREPEWSALARQALVPLRRRLAKLVAGPESSALRMGGLIGLGSLIYSFVRLGVWLEEPALVDEAGGLATLLTDERIAADECLDLMFGSAGALLGLLLLERECAPAAVARVRPLARAVACGEHLLRRRAANQGWAYRGAVPLCGFAHGASGISYALAMLARRTGRDDFRQAALAGLAFERLHYSPADENWRSSLASDRSLMMAWCNGAPGIALGRLRLADNELDGDLNRALASTRNAEESDHDFVCCGNMGRAEILLEAGEKLQRKDLRVASRELASRVAARAGFRQLAPDHPHYNPAFFRGAAGIGYSFLRCADPSLPCVLALE